MYSNIDLCVLLPRAYSNFLILIWVFLCLGYFALVEDITAEWCEGRSWRNERKLSGFLGWWQGTWCAALMHLHIKQSMSTILPSYYRPKCNFPWWRALHASRLWTLATNSQIGPLFWSSQNLPVTNLYIIQIAGTDDRYLTDGHWHLKVHVNIYLQCLSICHLMLIVFCCLS